MTKRVACLVGAAVAFTMVPGCDDPPAGGDGFCECGEVATRSVQVNGIHLNGIHLNGIHLNGIHLNGVRLGADGSDDYIQLEHINVKGEGVALESWLDGSMLVVKAHDGTLVSGGDLDSAKLKFDVKESGVQAGKLLKILDVEPLAPGSDVWLFDISMQVNGGGWQPLCLDAAGEPTQAILLGDLWSPDTGARRAQASGTMTFACRDAALAKCVEWGYRPWASAGETSLRDYHQACTRLVRADYCGDGVSHTNQGTPIHVLDPIGVQTLDPGASFVIEAEWGPNGAVCLNSANMRTGEQALGCQIPACGAAFSSGGLIQSGKIVVSP